MKAVVQRVKDAGVKVDGQVTGSIGFGLLVYLGVKNGDTEKEAEWMAEKIANLRIFNDGEGKMNLSLIDILKSDVLKSDEKKETGVLTVSQFTLLAEVGKGRRPYYGNAAAPEKAKVLYEYFMEKIREEGLLCQSGVFQAHMEVYYTNDGPVTIIIESC